MIFQWQKLFKGIGCKIWNRIISQNNSKKSSAKKIKKIVSKNSEKMLTLKMFFANIFLALIQRATLGEVSKWS